MSSEIPPLLTLLDVAKCCRVSPHTVRKWVRQGRLRPTRICSRLLFAQAELQRLLSESEPSRACARRA